jgi:hypothetical protein
MGAWFMAGGFGMVLIAALGLATIFVGASAIAGSPTEGRLRFLRAAPGLLGALAALTFGLNLWVVNRVVSEKGDLRIAFIGLFEAAQPLTLGGLLAAVAIVLGLFAQGRVKPAA